jgi:Holliday junction resolvase RusA-like endonuclease
MIGLAETVLDAMQGVVYVNDKQVRVLVMSMLKKGENTHGVTCRADITEL